MDKQEEIQKMAYSICPMPQASEYITNCEKCGYNGDCMRQKFAKKFIERGYGDTKAAVKEFITKFNENLVISFSLIDSVDTIADRVSECIDNCLLNTAKEYGITLDEEAEND